MRAHYVAAVVDLLAEMGVERTAVLEACALSEAELASENQLNAQVVRAVTELAGRLAPDPAVALLTGQRLNINSHGALGYAAMASANLEHAFRLLVKYYCLQAPGARFSVRQAAGAYEVVCDPSFTLEHAPWLTAEFLVTSVYTSVDFLLSGRTSGLEVVFRHAPPPHAQRYREFFHVPVRFAQPYDGLRVPEALAVLPLLSADAQAARLFEQRCRSVQHDHGALRISERVRALVPDAQGGFPAQAEIARKLHMSVSTLHRRLNEEGVSYRGLVSEIKRELALVHLRESALTVEEIAQLLGFSDASNFRRAFVAWTGCTPSAFRAAVRLR